MSVSSKSSAWSWWTFAMICLLLLRCAELSSKLASYTAFSSARMEVKDAAIKCCRDTWRGHANIIIWSAFDWPSSSDIELDYFCDSREKDACRFFCATRYSWVSCCLTTTRSPIIIGPSYSYPQLQYWLAGSLRVTGWRDLWRQKSLPYQHA